MFAIHQIEVGDDFVLAVAVDVGHRDKAFDARAQVEWESGSHIAVGIILVEHVAFARDAHKDGVFVAIFDGRRGGISPT